MHLVRITTLSKAWFSRASLLGTLLGLGGPVMANSALEARQVTSASNPILSDGQDYTTDPATLVANGKFYILTGRDTAESGVNDFVMPEWQMLVTDDPKSGRWTHYPHFLKPDEVFKWATPGRAYAAQIVQGPDKRFYFYAPVMQEGSTNKDGFAIGVAVSDSPTGPWVDAHPSGPVVSQSYPVKNDIQNIDPTVLIDDDGRIYMYWGTFGRLKGVELERDMVTFKGTPVDVTGLKGFFEAPWIFKRKGVYYMAYAGNTAGPDSECTEAVYYACIAYGTATSPLGPWTYRGVLLDPVSSTTSHPGISEFKGKWYVAYHTADAKGGGHFRRSVAVDELSWDDSVNPPLIEKVEQTRAAAPVPQPQRNLAPAARVVASNSPVPVQYWIRALNDGKVRQAPLPPDTWGTWSPNNPKQQWVVYQWEQPLKVNGTRLYFWADQPAGSGIGVAPPKAWHLEYWSDADKDWKVITASYPQAVTGAWTEASFDTVSTRCLKAVFDASTDGKTNAAVAVQEWEALYPKAVLVEAADTKVPASPICVPLE
ncbi:glycoside hydrolase family 43 [Asticcacaulis excentricus CB 48]|uniref:Glycoside hydrolase family 43 n=1 Tax=Asticcacaulis excentricus (strain ATCC 15261 / DSM 4724 / KCTC 12464 / NCIMB 9791 / VKM B-1370 / CB 48) TaxID=573065 RepID=E8RV37_ASTEC|nr:glycoside hydrolase family 43 [Asticcacaulis excentricus CB 48]